ncbi:hypothetical protein DIPPA_19056 [Diplonema papillatum]|nr:hypothetical protein DIPPA_19056 [Diplonema papillatum]
MNGTRLSLAGLELRRGSKNIGGWLLSRRLCSSHDVSKQVPPIRIGNRPRRPASQVPIGSVETNQLGASPSASVQSDKSEAAQANESESFPAVGAQLPARSGRFKAVFGHEGFKEDPLDRAEDVAKDLRKRVLAPEDVKAPEVGRGPKAVWSFVDSSPKGWWPTGEWYIGAPPDKSGRPAPISNTLKMSPAKITQKGVSSTDRSRELRDVWLTDMGMHRRFLMAAFRRLTDQEQEQVRMIGAFAKVIAALCAVFGGYEGYRVYKRYMFFEVDGPASDDPKITRIIADLRSTQNIRGEQYNDWLQETWTTMPMPPDFKAELELLWRECIKKGWVKLESDEKWMIAEPFAMKYIPPPTISVQAYSEQLGLQSRSL